MKGNFKIDKLLLLWILFFPTSSFAQEETKTTIVFVCEHGGARSTIASVYFNKLAEDNHLPYRSIFRGLTPDPSISKETKKGLTKDGFATKTLFPVALSEKDVANSLLISLDCIPPSQYQTYHSWNGVPAISENYGAARNAIVKHLNELIMELKTKKQITKN
ncbi:MAG: hypothetical protein HYR67_19940 [Bacteroidetes bacterium]|nr:hypothetical protein [Bacteroidota bacterium]